MLVDNFGRTINYLRVSITDRCNLKCLYCVPFDYKAGINSRLHEILSYEEMLRLIKAFIDLGIKKVRITGGEPFVRQNIIDFLQMLSDLNVEIAISTNGVLLKHFVDELYKINISSINIGLDTFDAKKYKSITNSDIDVSNVFDGIKACLSKKLKLKLNVVTIKGFNDDEILEFCEFAIKTLIPVRFIELMPICGEKIWKYENFLPNYHVKEICQKRFRLTKIQNLDTSTAVYYSLSDTGGIIGFISPLSDPFCNKCNKLRLTADGKLKLCLCSDSLFNLKPLLKSTDEILKKYIISVLKYKPESHSLPLITPEAPMIGIGG